MQYMLWKRINGQKGFTLIELLVVISIIGVLSTIAMTSLNSARAKARDAKRQSEIDQIRKALELYYADNNQYPVSGGAISPNNEWSSSNDSSWNSLRTQLAPYLTQLPKDPVNSPSSWAANANVYSYYSLSYGCNRQWYMIVYKPEARSSSSPGIKSCNGTYFNYNYAGAITVGDCKGCS